MRARIRLVIVVVIMLLPAASAFAGISRIFAHQEEFSANETIPVFVDSAKNSIKVKGQYMDLCTGVESSDNSFTVSIGNRVPGANSSVEILVGAGSAPDQDTATITIKFALGQETFKVKAFKIKVNELRLNGRAAPNCKSGETVNLVIEGPAMQQLMIGSAGAMLDVANNHYKAGHLGTTDATTAMLELKCEAPGTFTVNRQWFADRRLSLTNVIAANAMVRGSETLTVTVNPADPVQVTLPGKRD